MAWRPSVRSDAFDVALAVVLGGLAGLSLYVGGDPFLTAPELADYSRPWGIACLSVMHLALAVRRRYPLAVAVVVTAAFLPVRFLDVSEFQVVSVSLFIAIYSAGAYGGLRRHAVRGVIAVAIGVLVVWTVLRDPLEPYEGRIPLELLNAFTAAVNVFYVAAAWMLGDVVRTRREREAQLETQAVVLEEAHEERARRAVLAERIRIARELHDVVAHHVSVMGVQAGAARRVLDRRPDAVPELLGSIEDASRHAVDELHRLLGFLRSDDEVDGTGPQPSLARLDELLRQMRDAGLSVELTVDGLVDPVPAGVDLSAYRIVQEALTNT
jgi:signal transduction histidine kinase